MKPKIIKTLCGMEVKMIPKQENIPDRCHRGRITESVEPLFRCRYFYQVMNRLKSIVVCRILRSHRRTG